MNIEWAGRQNFNSDHRARMLAIRSAKRAVGLSLALRRHRPGNENRNGKRLGPFGYLTTTTTKRLAENKQEHAQGNLPREDCKFEATTRCDRRRAKTDEYWTDSGSLLGKTLTWLHI